MNLLRRPHQLRIIVLGYVIRGPVAGLAWHHLQYVIGLQRLGHDVHFIEDSDDYPSCYDPSRAVADADPSYGIEFARKTFARVGIQDRWAYYDAHTSTWLGPCADSALRICAEADVAVNISGVNPIRPWLRQIPHRILIDTDPGFTQVRHLTDSADLRRASSHTDFFSFAGNIGQPDTRVPDDGLPWQPTRQPIVLDLWPVTAGRPNGRFTTVMQWNSYPPVEYDGVRYGMKGESFDGFLDLPNRTDEVLELAVGGRPPLERLRRHGWRLRDPLVPTKDIETYQEYIRSSKAEFALAKHGYVVSRSGWFGERSACYLASGRPVVVQDTGFSRWLEGGSGVIPFATAEEALAGVAEINRDYSFHCRAAAEVAEEYFDSRKVLAGLLDSTLAVSRGDARDG